MSQGVESMRSRAAQTEADLAAARSLPEQVAPPVLGNERASVQQFDANGRPIDRGAQARMEKEHGIGKPVKSAQESAEVLDVLSFRRDMDALMKMDDATFQKRFTEVQYRKAH